MRASYSTLISSYNNCYHPHLDTPNAGNYLISCVYNTLHLFQTPNGAKYVSWGRGMALLNGLQLASWDPLKAAKGRNVCPKCNSSRKYFCYTCYEVVGLPPGALPSVDLPVSVDIIKHPGEVAGKSTAVHARILSPHHVTIYDYPTVPNYPDLAKVVLVYPKKDALTVPELAARLRSQAPEGQDGRSAWHQLDKVVFIDSTWQQTHRILVDEMIQKLTCVQLTDAVTCFWRPQAKSPNCLATIEAIYYFFKEMDSYLFPSPYSGCYDNLLYFYAYQYRMVQEAQGQKRDAWSMESGYTDHDS